MERENRERMTRKGNKERKEGAGEMGKEKGERREKVSLSDPNIPFT